MPIKPENAPRYPPDWPAISYRVRVIRAGGRCECTGQCGRSHVGEVAGETRCGARNGMMHPVTGSWVVLTTAHLDHVPEHCDELNLLAMCQACHLAYDAEHHARSRRKGARCTGTGDLFGDA